MVLSGRLRIGRRRWVADRRNPSRRRYRCSAASRQLPQLERFRPYSSDDVIGVQIGGAIKNVLAIGCGIADGRGFGDNARAALKGSPSDTAVLARADGDVMGLSGMGDLVLTCRHAIAQLFARPATPHRHGGRAILNRDADIDDVIGVPHAGTAAEDRGGLTRHSN